MNKNREFKRILEDEEFSQKEFAEELGLSQGSYRTMVTGNSGRVPRWVKAFLIGFRLGRK